jgi:DUF1680 family protein
MTGDAKYMDVFERTAYNGFLSGVSVSGDRFFYPNPLEYDGQKENNSHHAGRVGWFGCACCPPNLMRTLASLTGYFYATRDDSLYVNFYAQSAGETTVAGTKVKLTQTTNYPWQGSVRLAVAPERPSKFTLRVRIPDWAQGRPGPTDLYTFDDAHEASWSVRVGGTEYNSPLESGYAVITREWREGDTVELTFAEPVHRVRANPQVTADAGRVALERGPIVYCIEDTDFSGFIDGLAVPATAHYSIEARPLLGGLTVVTVGGATVNGKAVAPVTAIPYFAWDNRGLAPMAVWLKQAELRPISQ